jgi:hypothetical protein
MKNAVISRLKKGKSAERYRRYELLFPDQTGVDAFRILVGKEDKQQAVALVNSVQCKRGRIALETVKNIYLNGYSYKQLSAKTGLPIQTLRNAVTRGLKALKNKITRNGNINHEWLSTVRNLLISIGYRPSLVLSEKDWAPLYNDGLNPYIAICESEFGGKIKWQEFRKLQKRNETNL